MRELLLGIYLSSSSRVGLYFLPTPLCLPPSLSPPPFLWPPPPLLPHPPCHHQRCLHPSHCYLLYGLLNVCHPFCHLPAGLTLLHAKPICTSKMCFLVIFLKKNIDNGKCITVIKKTKGKVCNTSRVYVCTTNIFFFTSNIYVKAKDLQL